jgi:hypothetical protein
VLSGAKRRLQFTPRMLQLVAIGSRCRQRLPTVRLIESKRTRTKGPTMKTISMQVRLTSLLLAVAMSAVVLGSTVAGMQPGGADSTVVVLEKVTVKPSAIN